MQRGKVDGEQDHRGGRIFATGSPASGVVNHTEYGNHELALAGEILRTVVGSGVHGIAIEGTDDHDEMGIFVEPAARSRRCAAFWAT